MLGKTDYYFLTVVRAGSLNRAAETLYISQPSLTKYLHRLEAQLGTALFDRSRSPMTLTESGKIYYEYLLEAIDREQNLKTRIGAAQSETHGTLRLGIPSYCAQCYLPGILKKFGDRYPDVRLELLEDTGERVERALENHEIDLGFFHYLTKKPSLDYTPVLSGRILLAVPRKKEKKEGETRLRIRRASIRQFRNETFILPTPDQKIGQVVAELLEQQDFAPRILLNTKNIIMALYLTAAGNGACFTPESGLALQPAEVLDRIVFYRLKELEDRKWTLMAVRRKGYEWPAYTRYFIGLASKYDYRSPLPAEDRTAGGRS